jgi:hypothetical protein
VMRIDPAVVAMTGDAKTEVGAHLEDLRPHEPSSDDVELAFG